MPPTVSICLPVLNGRRFLEARMACLIGQTLTDWELIVCDSYSDDGTWEFLQSFKNDPRVRLYQVPREGVYAGWNECLKRCEGRYVYIAPADDTCDLKLLETMVSGLQRAEQGGDTFSNVRMAMCQFEQIDENGAVIPFTKDIPSDFFGELNQTVHIRAGKLEILVHLLLGISWVTYTAVLFRRDIVEETGLFPTDCGAMGDRIWAVASGLASDILVLPDRLATWRIHSGQLSKVLDLKASRQLYRMMDVFLERHQDRFPSEWRRDPEWKRLLLHGVRRSYLFQYGMDRLVLRHLPKRFFQRSLWALRYEPGYFMKRMISGLSWRPDEYRDERTFLRELMHRWAVSMPTSKGGAAQ